MFNTQRIDLQVFHLFLLLLLLSAMKTKLGFKTG